MDAAAKLATGGRVSVSLSNPPSAGRGPLRAVAPALTARATNERLPMSIAQHAPAPAVAVAFPADAGMCLNRLRLATVAASRCGQRPHLTDFCCSTAQLEYRQALRSGRPQGFTCPEQTSLHVRSVGGKCGAGRARGVSATTGAFIFSAVFSPRLTHTRAGWLQAVAPCRRRNLTEH